MRHFKTNYRAALSVLMGLMLTVSAFAQQIAVKGKVQSPDGEPLIGATVMVKGTSNGVASDLDGNFTINAKKGDTLVASYVGCIPQTAVVNGQFINFTLSEDSEALDELVVLGFGAAQRKQDLSAAVGVVANPDQLEKRPVTSTEAMLQGALPGVTVQNNGGDPTASPSLVIRGQGSGNDGVLWVVDGVPGAPITSLSDIESIVVLKDAASAAIYGAQSGAGGVILVTTKQGKQGPASLSYEGQFGWRKASNLIEPCNAEQQLELRRRSYAEAGLQLGQGWDPTYNPNIAVTRTNWMDEIFRTAFYQRHNIVLNGGNENFTNRLAFSLNNDEGVLRNTYSKNLSVNYKGTFKLNKWVTVREDLTWKNWESRSKGTDDAYTGPILSAVWMPASAWVYNPLDGTFGGVATEDPAYIAQYGDWAGIHADVVNPVRLLEAENRYNRTNDVWSTTSLEIADVVPGLKFVSRFTYNVANNNYKNFNPRVDEPGKPSSSNTLSVSNWRTDKWTSENTLTYAKGFGKNSIDLLFSVVADHYDGRTLNAYGYGLDDETDILQYLGKADRTSVTDAKWGPDNNVSLVARAAYSYDNRYFLTASWRRDYAGRLVKQSNHGDFPSVTAAWKLSSEKFFEDFQACNLFKIRGSWGKVGNLGSIPMGYKGALLGSWVVNDVTSWNGVTLNGTSNTMFYGNTVYNWQSINPNLTWETSEQWDLGLDLAFINDQLTFTADYFDKRTKNLIQWQSIDWPNTIGLSAQQINLGQISNKGVELSAGWNQRINRDWSWYVNGNFAWLKNEVAEIGTTDEDGNPGVWTYSNNYRNVMTDIYRSTEGQPLYSYWLIKTDGIFQSDAEAAAYVDAEGNRIQPNAKAGDLRFVDQDGNGVIDDGDRIYMGNAMPKTTYAFNLGATWKDLSVNVMFQGVGGAKAFYAAKYSLYNDAEGNGNRSADALNAWSATNMGSDIPRLSKSDPNGNYSTTSDWYLEDASYLRLKNVTVNYDLTRLVQKWAYLKGRGSRLNLYFSADNLFTITKYSGVDPECGGWDAMKYPVSRVYSFGINLTY